MFCLPEQPGILWPPPLVGFWGNNCHQDSSRFEFKEPFACPSLLPVGGISHLWAHIKIWPTSRETSVTRIFIVGFLAGFPHLPIVILQPRDKCLSTTWPRPCLFFNGSFGGALRSPPISWAVYSSFMYCIAYGSPAWVEIQACEQNLPSLGLIALPVLSTSWMKNALVGPKTPSPIW